MPFRRPETPAPKTRAVDVPAGQVVAFPTEPARDEELLQGLLSGRPVALSQLFDRYAPPVRRLLTRMLSDASEADDLTQETFLIVLRRIRDIQRPESLKSFVMATAVGTAKNELRRRTLRKWVGLDHDHQALVLEPCDPVVREQVERVQTLLQKLEPDTRALFLLRYVEGVELTELATIFRCSLATLKRRLARVEARFVAMARTDSALQNLLPQTKPEEA